MRIKPTKRDEAHEQDPDMDDPAEELAAEPSSEELASEPSAHLVETNRALSEHLETAKAVAAERKARLSAAQREAASAEEKAERLEAELAEINASLDETQSEARDLESQNARLRDELEKLVIVTEEYEQAYADVKDQMSSARSESKARLSRLESSEGLVADVVSVNRNLQAELASQREVSNGTKKAMRDLEVKMLELRKELVAARGLATEEGARAQGVQAALDEALDRSSKVKEEMEALTARSYEDAARIKKGEQVVADLRATSKQLRKELREARETAKSAADEKAAVSEQLEKTSADEARASRAVADLESEKRKLGVEVGEVRKAANSATARNEELEAQLDQARTEADEAVKQVADLGALSEAQLTKITELEERLRGIEKKLDDRTVDADVQRRRADEAEHRLERLKADLDTVRAAMDRSAASATYTLESARDQLRATDRQLLGAMADIRMEVVDSHQPPRTEDLLEALSSDATLLVLDGDALAMLVRPDAAVQDRRQALLRALELLAADQPASIEVAFDGNVLATPPAVDDDAQIRVRLTRVGVSGVRAMRQIIQHAPFGTQILVVADPESRIESRRDYQALPMATLMNVLPEVPASADQEVVGRRSPELAVVDSGSDAPAAFGGDASEGDDAAAMHSTQPPKPRPKSSSRGVRSGR